MVNLSEMGNITNLTGRDFIKGYQDEIPATFSSTSDVKKKDIVPTIFPASCVTGLGSYTPKGSLERILTLSHLNQNIAKLRT